MCQQKILQVDCVISFPLWPFWMESSIHFIWIDAMDIAGCQLSVGEAF